MNKFFALLGPLGVLGLLGAMNSSLAQAQPGSSAGPGNQPATLKVPWLEGTPAPGSGLPAFVGNGLPGNTLPPGPSSLSANRGNEKADPNQDIQVTPARGPWLICVNWYSGLEAPGMARQMVLELRNQYQLPAFVFNKGLEERRKEEERIKALVDKQREFFRQNNLPLNLPIRIKRLRIEEQCAVLVGGYQDHETARRTLDEVRKLPPPNPERVKLATMFYQDVDEKTGKVKKEEMVYVNPFSKAFVVRNPALKFERPPDWDKADMAALHKLNRGESFSLLNCKKPFTLAIRQFMTPSAIQPRSASGTFLETLGLGGRSQDGIDAAAHNAHNLAELLRKSVNLETYVLHTRFGSLVTVGSFDTLEDPNLRTTQELLTSRLKIPQAVPMQVPR